MLADDITHALPELRAHAESLMLDTGVAYRATGMKVYDPKEQAEVDEVLELFTSKARTQDRNPYPTAQDVGGRIAVTVIEELHLPADTAPLETGDMWEVTATHPTSLASVGDLWRVRAPSGKTLNTARRYQVERVVS